MSYVSQQDVKAVFNRSIVYIAPYPWALPGRAANTTVAFTFPHAGKHPIRPTSMPMLMTSKYMVIQNQKKLHALFSRLLCFCAIAALASSNHLHLNSSKTDAIWFRIPVFFEHVSLLHYVFPSQLCYDDGVCFLGCHYCIWPLSTLLNHLGIVPHPSDVGCCHPIICILQEISPDGEEEWHEYVFLCCLWF